ncbi:tRNA preQ1(34) S-adenosylmethionine ribosyltransferase-isomerase QueA [Gottschalkiaceae bacterium SANA]|nr:tRNA preQ1(34) S-adenosylmethionine ribosyltransferase-isomerase QueA [Gottschalkiaceae bacterium SANA]
MNKGLKRSDYDFDLPKELIAQTPLTERTHSRLMVVDPEKSGVDHRRFDQILDYLEPGDCLVLNNTRVLPARLFGRKVGSGGKVELLLLKQEEGDCWETLVKPGRNARVGQRIEFGDGRLQAVVEGLGEQGARMIRFEYEGIFEEILDSLGEMPLPPYITERLENQERYQTVYSKEKGSAAAPTAGLHFTENLMDQIREKGVKIAFLTLHVGLGTFRPVKEDNILDHEMHAEFYRLDEENARLINETKDAGHRIIAVGTTSTRTLESVVDDQGRVAAGSGWTSIFIYPGKEVRLVDALITNFHLPESTLLMLVSAMVGRERVLAAYQTAVEERYRFFSFGDAMLITGKKRNQDGQ